MSNPTVQELTAQWLKDNGYDGLYNDDDCGCTLDDFVPCGHLDSECRAGHVVKDDGTFKFVGKRDD